MLKLLLLAIIFWLIYAILKHYRNSVQKRPPSRSSPEDMVQCAHCHVHLPRSESVKSGALHYCSDAHRQQHQE
ncbi:PP0621 family protein [Methylobacillus flagellatus]|nr:PP0621 family protein [Methylobacillus flagellatus]